MKHMMKSKQTKTQFNKKSKFKYKTFKNKKAKLNKRVKIAFFIKIQIKSKMSQIIKVKINFKIHKYSNYQIMKELKNNNYYKSFQPSETLSSPLKNKITVYFNH